MEIYNTEEQQVEAIKRFWQENGTSIMAGIVLGFAGLYGFRYYQETQLSALAVQSASYSQLLEKSQVEGVDKNVWLTEAQTFIEANQGSAYSELAALLAAKEAVLKQDYSAAEQQLSWVLSHSDSAEMKAVAQLRLARVQAEQAKYTDAIKTLDTPMPASFSAQLNELQGDIWLKAGDETKAKAAYKAAQTASEAGKNPLLDVKLNELAHVAG